VQHHHEEEIVGLQKVAADQLVLPSVLVVDCFACASDGPHGGIALQQPTITCLLSDMPILYDASGLA
jgi:hypothetical protein